MINNRQPADPKFNLVRALERIRGVPVEDRVDKLAKTMLGGMGVQICYPTVVPNQMILRFKDEVSGKYAELIEEVPGGKFMALEQVARILREIKYFAPPNGEQVH